MSENRTEIHPTVGHDYCVHPPARHLPEKAYLIVATLNDADDSWGIGVRFSAEDAREDLGEMLEREYPHIGREEMPYPARKLLAHWRNSGTPKIGNRWWVSEDGELWISDLIRYHIHEFDATRPLVPVR